MFKKTFFLTALIALIPLAFAEAASHPWDFLRSISSMAYSFDSATRVLVFVFALALCFIALKAYLKNKSRRLLLISGAFFLFAVKWFLKILDLFLSPGSFLPDASENVFELFILLFLFIALFFKPKQKGV
ncbi:MAG: hypothetical protein ABH986_05480 [archaeon]